MGKPATPALAGKDIDFAGQDLARALAEGNAAATRILEDVFRVAEHEKDDYVCNTTKDPLALFAVLRDEKITGAKISDIYLHLCHSSAAHLVAVLTVAAHPRHFSDHYYQSARFYLGLLDPKQARPIPIKEFHAGVVMQLKVNAGHADVHSTQVH